MESSSGSTESLSLRGHEDHPLQGFHHPNTPSSRPYIISNPRIPTTTYFKWALWNNRCFYGFETTKPRPTLYLSNMPKPEGSGNERHGLLRASVQPWAGRCAGTVETSGDADSYRSRVQLGTAGWVEVRQEFRVYRLGQESLLIEESYCY